MRVFKNKAFHRWARRIKLTDKQLFEAVEDIAVGKVDADLGGSIYKKRVALNGRGKRGGVRTLVAFKTGKNTFFLYGFAKNVRSNISINELKALKKISGVLFSLEEVQLEHAKTVGKLYEVVV